MENYFEDFIMKRNPNRTKEQVEQQIRELNDEFLPTQGLERTPHKDPEGYAIIDAIEPIEMTYDEAIAIIKEVDKIKNNVGREWHRRHEHSGAQILTALRVIGDDLCKGLGTEPHKIYGLIAEKFDTCLNHGVVFKESGSIGVQLYKLLDAATLENSPTGKLQKLPDGKYIHYYIYHDNEAKEPLDIQDLYTRRYPAEMVYYLAHEIFHNFQFASKANTEWENEYVPAAENPDMYHAQPIERDANIFALEVVEALGLEIVACHRDEWEYVIETAKKSKPAYDEFIKTYKPKSSAANITDRGFEK